MVELMADLMEKLHQQLFAETAFIIGRHVEVHV